VNGWLGFFVTAKTPFWGGAARKLDLRGGVYYVVLDSGIDSRAEAQDTNSLQVPKLADYAIVDLREPPGARWPGKIADAGFYDGSWKQFSRERETPAWHQRVAKPDSRRFFPP
jgi:hypothetical protein